MSNTLFSATGCARCKITKSFMQQRDIAYDEFDIKADGKDTFAKFYRENRKNIYRDKEGVEFPVFSDGSVIRQGASVIIGYLIAGDNLGGFIGRNTLHGEWIDGFNLSGGHPKYTEELLQVLDHLKKNGLKIKIATDGRNASVLQAVQEKNLADSVIMDVCGPAVFYESLTKKAIDDNELKRSIELTARFSEYGFQTTVAPVTRQDGTLSYLTPEEVGQTAQLIEAATGSKKHPYRICRAELPPKDIEPLPDNALFKYRTAARRYMVMADIKK